MDKYTYRKSTSERYDIKLEDGLGWAIITIDEDGGIFNAQSDFGDYHYIWSSHGRESFKHFILELVKDKSYFLGKVADDKYYYQNETKKAWKEAVIRLRKDGDLDKKKTREVWNEIVSFDYSSDPNIQYQCYQNDVICKYLCEPWYEFEVVHGFSPQALAFANIIMPIFGEIIKEEIDKI